ncbi:MAG: hypothetical protein U5N56_08205 [Candidatus Marinimicrobia bacterium]|nr:hypothetical protein [Candidatus Neomarinimicrobiota bacterium]
MKKCKRISTIISGRWLSFFAVTVLALALIIPTAAKSATALDLEASVDAETTVVEITVAQPLEEYVWVKYIVQPGDYIQKIAIQEYGVTAMWRDIWRLE